MNYTKITLWNENVILVRIYFLQQSSVAFSAKLLTKVLKAIVLLVTSTRNQIVHLTVYFFYPPGGSVLQGDRFRVELDELRHDFESSSGVAGSVNKRRGHIFG